MSDLIEQTGWLIHKSSRGWYRPNAEGYTNTPSDAGRYTYGEALRHCHPNGPDGPRDGLSMAHESEVDGAMVNLEYDRIAALEAEVERLRKAGDGLADGIKRCAEIVRLYNHRQNEKIEDVKMIAHEALTHWQEVSNG